QIAKDYPEVHLTHMYVDNAAMQLIRKPKQFDVIVTSNLFGDILSDSAAMLTGSIGMLPSASLNASNFGLYEPVHGSAPNIANLNQANPLGLLLSLSMMLRYSLDALELANLLELAIQDVLQQGWRTMDIHCEDTTLLSCSQMGDKVAASLQKLLLQ
ncbi:MAG TPA: isocitrate/isopropylmalate family dehydrogenase, partial [Gammaproteobacteria bacterium]|nr:isocitrate/isopropylmalate family dehydrogenase [Gammaproteobacteria bacterium]